MQAVPVLSSLYPSFIYFLSFTFPGAPYWIFFHFLPCHFYLVVIEQQQRQQVKPSHVAYLNSMFSEPEISIQIHAKLSSYMHEKDKKFILKASTNLDAYFKFRNKAVQPRYVRCFDNWHQFAFIVTSERSERSWFIHLLCINCINL